MIYSLLIDTSKPESYVALLGDAKMLAKRQWVSDRTLSNKLLSAIDEILEEQGLNLSQISRYGVQIGPGHYSALRTGIVVSTMLAYANQVEIIAVESSPLDEQIKELQTSQPVDNVIPVYDFDKSA